MAMAMVGDLFPTDAERARLVAREQRERQYHGTTREQLAPILERLGSRWHGGHWVDPCAGKGEIQGLVYELLPFERRPVFWTCFEIRSDPHSAASLEKRAGEGARSRQCRVFPGYDFLVCEPSNTHGLDVELVITNLPWPEPGLAIVAHAFEIYPHADVLALYDLCCAAKDWRPNDTPRAQWLAEHAPDEYRLPWRARFAGERGGYPHAVAWMHWPRDKRNRARGEYEYLSPG